MRPRFIVINVAILALIYSGWRIGLFEAFSYLGTAEIIMLAFLACYSLTGFIAAWKGQWGVARHVANGIPMWGLGLTGLGMVMAVARNGSLTEDGMLQTFRDLTFSITPNILGVALLAWIREIAWWCSGEEI